MGASYQALKLNACSTSSALRASSISVSKHTSACSTSSVLRTSSASAPISASKHTPAPSRIRMGNPAWIEKMTELVPILKDAVFLLPIAPLVLFFKPGFHGFRLRKLQLQDVTTEALANQTRWLNVTFNEALDKQTHILRGDLGALRDDMTNNSPSKTSSTPSNSLAIFGAIAHRPSSW
ncbi:hypothetical protein T492DRAFT_1093995 [Pavlovales sp. CCMP2436]|nr:hypothetical protein T492DRAFT_1093995 [Pavlovales sp. CCMP2436]